MKQTIQIDIDYTQALLWFDHAAQMKDPTISDEALLAKEELVASLNKAKKVSREESSTRSSTISHTNLHGPCLLTHSCSVASRSEGRTNSLTHTRARLICVSAHRSMQKS